MENVKVKEFVLKISDLWNEQKKREVLYLEALKKDSMGSLRKLLSQGHFSALLFQKEIRSIYDYFKCLMTDKDLGDLSQTFDDHISFLQGIEEKEEVAEVLRNNENAVLNVYKTLFKQLEKDSEIRKILEGQLSRISEFYEILSKQTSSVQKRRNYTSAV